MDFQGFSAAGRNHQPPSGAQHELIQIVWRKLPVEPRLRQRAPPTMY